MWVKDEVDRRSLFRGQAIYHSSSVGTDPSNHSHLELYNNIRWIEDLPFR